MGIPKSISCFFCGRQGRRGLEHVFARAWLAELRAGQERLEIERRQFEDDVLKEARAHTYDAFQCGDVCEHCNRGWMSELEAAVKPWILGIVAKPGLKMLQEPTRRLVFSRWAVKTACVIDHLGGIREIPLCIPRQLALATNTVPANVHVMVGWLPYEHRALFSFNQRNTWTKYPGESCELPSPLPEGWFKVAFSIERLMVLVAGMPSPDFRLVFGGMGVHLPIWPTTKIGYHHWYYPMRLEGATPPAALQNFSDLLGIVRKGHGR